MAFPLAAADGDVHVEGAKTYAWNAAGNAWLRVQGSLPVATDQGTVSTSAALDALTGDAGDTAYLDTADGGREPGFYVLQADGVTWSAAAAAGLGDNLLGEVGTQTSFARQDHRHEQSRGPDLPPTDGSEGIRHVSDGHGTRPDGDYVLVGTSWVEV